MFTTKNVKSKLSSWMRNSARCERGRDVHTFELTTSLVTRSLFFLLWSVAFWDDTSSYTNHYQSSPRCSCYLTVYFAVGWQFPNLYWLIIGCWVLQVHILGPKPQACKYIYGSFCQLCSSSHSCNQCCVILFKKKKLSFIAFAWTNMSVYHMT